MFSIRCKLQFSPYDNNQIQQYMNTNNQFLNIQELFSSQPLTQKENDSIRKDAENTLNAPIDINKLFTWKPLTQEENDVIRKNAEKRLTAH